MKKSIIWAFIGLVALASCEREADFRLPSEGSFTATTETSSTRTNLSPNGENYDVLWSKGDRITIVDASGNVGVYSTESVTSEGVFDFVSGQEAVAPGYKAYFPASIYNEGSPTLPATLEYVAGNIHTAPMYAASDTKDLAFKNLCGIVRVKVSSTQADKKVRKIVLSADKGLSGAFTVNDENAAVVTGTAGVTLDCGEGGVAIGEEAVPFFIAVPAGTYNPFKITVVTTEEEVQTRVSSTDIVITRSNVTTITLNFGELGPTAGSAAQYGGGTQPWVQLWPGGPKWAKFNVGSTIDSYAGVTDYTNPDVVGGYYSYKGFLDSTPNANATDDTATTLWGENWATPTREQQQELLSNCEWTWCDGSTVQFEEGCTLVGWKVSGKEPGYEDNAIFLPLSGVRDQNSRARQNVGDRGCYWSISDGGYGAYYLHVRSNTKEMTSHNQPHGCSVRAICVGDAPYVEGVFEVTAANFKRILYQFNEYPGENPRLVVTEDLSDVITITRPDGELDLDGHTVNKIYLQNNEVGKTVTVKNGTVTGGIDGKDGQGYYFAGGVLLVDLNVSTIWTDGHAYEIDGGTYDKIELAKNADTPGTVVIRGGSFGDIYRYVDRYNKADDGSAFLLYGGKYTTRPAFKWCADGNYVTANTGDDAETYPFFVVEGNPADNWFNGPATDLSAEGTANTYMVHAAGTYKFKATVKGNGGLDPVSGAAATPIPEADIDGAVVLWELKQQGLAVKYEDEFYQIDVKDGYVYFNTPDSFVPGSAYVAVFKDGEGGKAGRYDKDVDEILWSWLVWATEKPATMQIEDLGIMDRNIGALNVDADMYKIGFEYQWGRKDPFPGGGAYNRGTQNTFVPTKDEAFALERFPTGTTIAYSVAHPTTVFGPWNYESWLCEEEFTTNLWSDTEKTIYDPCPLGWRIPSKDDLGIILSGVSLPGAGGANPEGFFNAYCNGSSPYYWSSTGVSRTSAWASIGGLTSSHYDLRLTTAMSIRPVREERVDPIPPIPGSANTFMLTEGGTFSFDATVKGDGARDPMTGERATRIDKAQIAGVKVLWEVYEAGRAIRQDENGYAVSYADGKVSLTTPDPFISGAACVAIYDASETILWSWIIWTTPEPGIKEHNGKEFMDRNLGAVDAGNCMRGFLFEWGRKDGFSAANGGYQVYPYVPEARYVFTHENGPKTLAESVAHPTVWYRGAGTYNYSWMPLSDFSLKPWRPWEKTIYDPCPEGWRIPTRDEIRSISGMPNTGIGGGYDPDEYYKGFGNPGTGYYWTSSSDGNDDMRAYAFVNDGRNIQHWGQDQGYAIRCVRMD